MSSQERPTNGQEAERKSPNLGARQPAGFFLSVKEFFKTHHYLAFPLTLYPPSSVPPPIACMFSRTTAVPTPCLLNTLENMASTVALLLTVAQPLFFLTIQCVEDLPTMIPDLPIFSTNSLAESLSFFLLPFSLDISPPMILLA